MTNQVEVPIPARKFDANRISIEFDPPAVACYCPLDDLQIPD
jgi:hypothetical protein